MGESIQGEGEERYVRIRRNDERGPLRGAKTFLQQYAPGKRRGRWSAQVLLGRRKDHL